MNYFSDVFGLVTYPSFRRTSLLSRAVRFPWERHMPCGRLSLGLSDRQLQGGEIGIRNVSPGSGSAGHASKANASVQS